ncbi:hypothetical protein, partial [Ralstonia solanacearum]|uniref:hypothetical protein n=1 Tax=Ralstonia solanacearum TaxID=305 RepID=UPI001E647EF8
PSSSGRHDDGLGYGIRSSRASSTLSLYLYLPPDTLSDERDGQAAFASPNSAQRKPFEKLVHMRVVHVEPLKGLL